VALALTRADARSDAACLAIVYAAVPIALYIGIPNVAVTSATTQQAVTAYSVAVAGDSVHGRAHDTIGTVAVDCTIYTETVS